MEATKRDQLVEAATQAKISLETYTNPALTSRAHGGEALRLHDFINTDIPLMIAAANGKLGTRDFPVFDLKDDRINTRLDMEPHSLKQRIDQDYEAARYAMNWVGPHLPPAAAQFFKRGPEGGYEQLRDHLVEQRQEAFEQPNDIMVAFKRGGKNISSDELDTEIVSYVEDLAAKRDQFLRLKDGERVRVDVMVFDFADHSHNYWTNKYTVSNAEGQMRMVGEGDIDRGDAAYGVIVERNDKTYFVPMNGKLDGTPEGNAREVIGVDSGIRKYFESEMPKEAIDYANGEQIIRTITGRDVAGNQQVVAGEVHYANVNHQHDDRGPILLRAMPWMRTPDLKERLAAERMTDIQEFRTGKMIERAIVTNDAAPDKSVKADPSKMAMQLAAAQAQGMAV